MSTLAVTTLEMVATDTLPEFEFQYLEDDEVTPIDITGFTITMKIKRPSPSALLTKTMTITDAALGKFKVEWTTGDVVAGKQKAHVIIVDTLSKQITFKGIFFEIAEAL